MSAIALLLVGLGAMALGYVFYSKFIAERIYRLDPNYRTPAHTMRDGVDYVPTNKFVLWGHHFTSVAGGTARHIPAAEQHVPEEEREKPWQRAKAHGRRAQAQPQAQGNRQRHRRHAQQPALAGGEQCPQRGIDQ